MEAVSFFSRGWNVGTNPHLAFASFGQESRLPDRRVLGKLQRPQHRPPIKKPPRLKVPTHSNPVKRWNFRKADWKRFCLLTGDSVERLQPPDTPNIGSTYQILERGYYPRPNNVSRVVAGRNMRHAGTKNSRSFSSEPQWGLTLIEPLRPSYLSYNRRSRSDRMKLLIPSTSRTLAARRGEPSTNLLAGLDAPLACAQGQIPSSNIQAAHVSPTSWGTSQEADILRSWIEAEPKLKKKLTNLILTITIHYVM